MKINYFEDTDTALIEFTDRPVAETREVSENVTLDLDADGNLVAMTIEHAGEKANILDFAFERCPKAAVMEKLPHWGVPSLVFLPEQAAGGVGAAPAKNRSFLNSCLQASVELFGLGSVSGGRFADVTAHTVEHAHVQLLRRPAV